MKTAMQELKERLFDVRIRQNPITWDEINQFIEKEKEQIINAVNSHDKDCIRTTNNVIRKLKPSCKMLFEYDGKAGIEYYNKTFTT